MYDPEKHHRRSIRLQGWDYSSAGAYFVTIVVLNREMLFGDVSEGQVVLSQYGKIVEEEWLKSEAIRKEIALDEFIVMPNHFHAIVWISSSSHNSKANQGRPVIIPQSLGSLIVGFKSATSSRINKLRGPEFVAVWQRGYYERIIRNEQELIATREYIQNNPLNWPNDEENVMQSR